MSYNRANVGHANYALTAFSIILVLSILFSGEPIASSQGLQGPRPVELNHPIASSQGLQGPIQSSGQFRCTDGSLVRRSSDCTSDECPVSTSNHLVQCTPETFRHNQENDRIGHYLHCADGASFPSSHFFGCHEFQEYYTKKVFNNYFQYTPASSNIPYYVSISTNKNTYKMGENVQILLKNTGSKPLVFTNVNSRLEIRNLGTGQSFLLNMPLPFVLSPEETNTITWNQHNTMEQQVNPGSYAVTIFWDQINSSAAFTI